MAESVLLLNYNKLTNYSEKVNYYNYSIKRFRLATHTYILAIPHYMRNLSGKA